MRPSTSRRELKKKCSNLTQQTLLEYLLLDEEKHDVMLGRLEQFRKAKGGGD